MVNFNQKLVNVWQNKIKYNEKCSKLPHFTLYRIDSKSSLRCHSLRSERTCAENPEEEACTIDRIASATAVRTLDFIGLKEGPPSCTICGRVIP